MVDNRTMLSIKWMDNRITVRIWWVWKGAIDRVLCILLVRCRLYDSLWMTEKLVCGGKRVSSNFHQNWWNPVGANITPKKLIKNSSIFLSNLFKIIKHRLIIYRQHQRRLPAPTTSIWTMLINEQLYYH